LIDISPNSTGNNPLGADTGTGVSSNPVTGNPYTPNWVKRGDYTRVLAEFWADGPRSETPPGHWHVLANELADMPLLQKRIGGGSNPIVNDLEWDVKMYFALSAGTHDAACAAWALKRHYSGPRPITMIRYMAGKGQSSDPTKPNYHAEGLPLEPGVCEQITAASSAVGQRHETILDLRYGIELPGSSYQGQLVVRCWAGEHPSNPQPTASNPTPAATHHSPVRWMLAKDWLPFQRKTFVTPAFPGYVSGHSTFSRAAAEVLTKLTGTPYFPGGFHHHTIAQNSLGIDLGPSTDVDLQWCTYYDAADQAGQSRIYGGIHVTVDDYHGRIIGSMAGISAYDLASSYWEGAVADPTEPQLTRLSNGHVKLTWQATRGFYHRVEGSTDLQNWAALTSYALTYDPNATWTDTVPHPQRKFYRIRRQAAPLP
jgi:hypothetical protein